MFQDSTQFYLKPQNMTSSHSYFFFYPPDQKVHKCPNKLASDKRPEFDTRQTEEISSNFKPFE